MLNNRWLMIMKSIEIEYHPIVNIFTSSLKAVELKFLYRGSHFRDVKELFQSASRDRVTFHLTFKLIKNALYKLRELKNFKDLTIFIDLDERLLVDMSSEDKKSEFLSIPKRLNLSFNSICFNLTISDFNYFLKHTESILLMKHYGIKISIDNFGGSSSDFKMLYLIEPDFIKIDKFFTSNIETNFKKRLILSHILNITSTLGIHSIADGVDNKKTFFVCKNIGFNLIRGEIIMYDSKGLQSRYSKIEEFNKSDLKTKNRLSDKKLIKNEIVKIEPIGVDSPTIEVFSRFKREKDMNFLPVVSSSNEPIGLIREKNLKEYVYSQYGKELLLNKSIGKSLIDFTSKCSIVDIETDIEQILDIFSNDYSSEGIIITKEFKYIGFLTAKSLIKILNEKNLNIARNQNPLTKLAGNSLINEYIESRLSSNEKSTLAYFDFDNFKPYNDKYGFRQGDRAILLFSEILQKELFQYNCFIGHIGGDDFFIGLNSIEFDISIEIIKKLQYKFSEEVKNFYSKEDRESNYITSKDRDGNIKRFPLLTVSSAIVNIRESENSYKLEDISNLIANLKKVAKKDSNKLATSSII